MEAGGTPPRMEVVELRLEQAVEAKAEKTEGI